MWWLRAEAWAGLSKATLGGNLLPDVPRFSGAHNDHNPTSPSPSMPSEALNRRRTGSEIDSSPVLAFAAAEAPIWQPRPKIGGCPRARCLVVAIVRRGELGGAFGGESACA